MTATLLRSRLTALERLVGLDGGGRCSTCEGRGDGPSIIMVEDPDNPPEPVGCPECGALPPQVVFAGSAICGPIGCSSRAI